jgi:hypothetical protein
LNYRWILALVGLILIFGSCAAQRIWQSQPLSAQLARPEFEATLNPVSPEDANFFVGFQFTLVNRSAQPLQIDWTQSRYLADGQPQGTFVFEGLTAETVRSPPVESVPAGQTLTKLIWPLQLLGWVPIKDKSLDADTPGFSPGVLPEGENGMLLVIGQGSNWKRYSLQVSLSSRRP